MCWWFDQGPDFRFIPVDRASPVRQGPGMGRTFLSLITVGMAAATGLPQCARAQEMAEVPPPATTITMTPAQLFDFADQARDRGDYAVAEAAYRALATNPDIEIRSEARFRLGMMLADRQQRYGDAAVEFRKILDEKPKAGRVRLELARMHALLGHPGAAAREFRAAQASGLPPQVQQVVRFYANAFDAQKPAGFSFGISLAPDTNINRATRSDTLGTIIGDFTLDNNAKAKSGVGLSLRGQAYYRTAIDRRARLLVQVSGQGDLYRQSDFNDVIVALQAGPEYQSGKDRIYLGGTASWRWYGGTPYSQTLGINGSLRHPLGPKDQLQFEAGIGQDDNRRNNLQDSTTINASIGYDRAFSARFGGGLSLSGNRSTARDPGYSLSSGGAGGYLFREFGPVTGVLNLGYSHLEADARLFLYPRRRIDDRFSAGIGVTLRSLRFGNFAPLARLRFERNNSTIEIYDYSRFSGEFGVTAAF
jgi:outer membrane protein